ncbi:MAG TPA: AAC(3) family N-acetyltransferase [Armatimonadota bacterium]|nr:AAC(3) family N-acetyltransferase [Armatimonadota bacterium]
MSIDTTIQQIADDLLTAGIRPGGVILVHSSLRSLGPVPGGAETVIQGLLRALGDEGTLLIPALSFALVHADNPYFDVKKTPANIGALSEYFRTRPGTLRSVHPTHSVCGIGPAAEKLLANHHLDSTPVGPHSPFRRLREVGGQVCFLGCGPGPNTSMHGVEEVAEAPYLFGKTITYHLTLENGDEYTMACRRHGFGEWRQRYDRLVNVLEGDELHVGTCLQGSVHVIDAPAMWERGVATIRKDPYYFVEKG